MEENMAFLINLPTGVHGLVMYDEDGEPVIIVNARLTREANQHTFLHEKEHINRGDMDNPDYMEYMKKE